MENPPQALSMGFRHQPSVTAHPSSHFVSLSSEPNSRSQKKSAGRRSTRIQQSVSLAGDRDTRRRSTSTLDSTDRPKHDLRPRSCKSLSPALVKPSRKRKTVGKSTVGPIEQQHSLNISAKAERRAQLPLSPSPSSSQETAYSQNPAKRPKLLTAAGSDTIEVDISSSAQKRKRLDFSSRSTEYSENLQRKATVRSDQKDDVAKTYDLSSPRSIKGERPYQKDLPVPEEPVPTQEDIRRSPIRQWAETHTWPENFADYLPMSSSNEASKRQRVSDAQSGSRSYSRSRKAGDVPEQYTKAYEILLSKIGVIMDILEGANLASAQSREIRMQMQKVQYSQIHPTIFPAIKLRHVVNLRQNRNEAIVQRDITPMLLPPIASLYLDGDQTLEHICDEVKATWFAQCVILGPRPQPDLAVGLFESSFTDSEVEILNRYKSTRNWTNVTEDMYFPFLMCEVKCGTEGLDRADRQNMHSCSIAVRAVLRIVEEADKYRSAKELATLSGQILVFSISHDQKDVRIYGHYAVCKDKNWSYYRYAIKTFNILTNDDDLLLVYNFVRNVLTVHAESHLKRLQAAISALPEPTGLSFSATDLSLYETSQESQEIVTGNDATSAPQATEETVFKVPDLPQRREQDAELRNMRQQNDMLLKRLQQQEERTQHLLQQLEEQRNPH